jgi:hypothetical protein
MFIPDPVFCQSGIPDPKTATKERGEKNLLFYTAGGVSSGTSKIAVSKIVPVTTVSFF